jgi:hypothetical protein
MKPAQFMAMASMSGSAANQTLGSPEFWQLSTSSNEMPKSKSSTAVLEMK